MSADPIYYRPEPLDKNSLTQVLSGMVQNFVDGVIGILKVLEKQAIVLNQALGSQWVG